MGKREEAVEFLRLGLTPGQIAETQGVTLNTILSYLEQKVGQGAIRRTELVFSIPRSTRAAILAAMKPGKTEQAWVIEARLRRRGTRIHRDDIEVVSRYASHSHSLGELYEELRQTELLLHGIIEGVLKAQYGPSEGGWWRQGIPVGIRKKCQERREDDDLMAGDTAYKYTDILDLGAIIDSEWGTIGEYLVGLTKGGRKSCARQIRRLNDIRRRVMHPVRLWTPDEDDFAFVAELRATLQRDLQAMTSARDGVTVPESDTESGQSS